MTARLVFIALALSLLLPAQKTGEQAPGGEKKAEQKTIHLDVGLTRDKLEEIAFQQIMENSRNSPLDTMNALARFLDDFPESKRRSQIEHSLIQTAIEQRNQSIILRFGEDLVKREPQNILVLEHLTRALLSSNDRESSRKALRYATQYETALRVLELQQPDGPSQQAEWRNKLDLGFGKARVYQARALGNLGRFDEAVTAAKLSYKVMPSAEAAREAGRWLARKGDNEQAIEWYANSFAMQDPYTTARLRAGDRKHLRELYLQSHDSEAGLGDLVLAAYDRTTKSRNDRLQALRKINPNYGVSNPMKFVLSGLDGDHIEMNSLLGKVIVIDFWATWCKPCLIQQPLYEQVKEKYAGNDDVVFLSVSTDIDRAMVAPFLEKNHWDKTIYFDDGLRQLLKVSSIPTTIVIGRDGHLASRIVGFQSDRFVDMLAARIDDNLKRR